MAARSGLAEEGFVAARKIGFIGGGNMARAIVLGLIANGHDPKRIAVADTDSAKLHALASEHGINAASHEQIGRSCELIVLAVKPQAMTEACSALQPALRGRAPVVMSLAAGTRLARLEHLLGAKLPLARCMPNTPALLGAGATALFANRHVTAEQKRELENLMNSVGISAWVERETDLDIVTALSGSGPAHFFLFMEALRDAAARLGLDQDLAERFTCQTALGAARLASRSEAPLAELRAQVTSPGGTTAAALASFEQGGLHELVDAAVAAAAARANELAMLTDEGRP